mmetsp:Transcript_27146/g.65222  ORF Transcript_27146/g.65222 Transcript_27146/m.65222 type:complete len:207 (+) Transcript_27146:1217-1837(+)
MGDEFGVPVHGGVGRLVRDRGRGRTVGDLGGAPELEALVARAVQHEAVERLAGLVPQQLHIFLLAPYEPQCGYVHQRTSEVVIVVVLLRRHKLAQLGNVLGSPDGIERTVGTESPDLIVRLVEALVAYARHDRLARFAPRASPRASSLGGLAASGRCVPVVGWRGPRGRGGGGGLAPARHGRRSHLPPSGVGWRLSGRSTGVGRGG